MLTKEVNGVSTVGADYCVSDVRYTGLPVGSIAKSVMEHSYCFIHVNKYI